MDNAPPQSHDQHPSAADHVASNHDRQYIDSSAVYLDSHPEIPPLNLNQVNDNSHGHISNQQNANYNQSIPQSPDVISSLTQGRPNGSIQSANAPSVDGNLGHGQGQTLAEANMEITQLKARLKQLEMLDSDVGQQNLDLQMQNEKLQSHNLMVSIEFVYSI